MSLYTITGLTARKCSHYRRHCAFIAPCCQKMYICRFCHNENETHELDRHTVNEVQCLECDSRQPIAPACNNCGACFGRYFCEICRMFDDTEKQQFHCDACGICRVGGREKFFHCPKCDMCLRKDLKGVHQCVERATHSGCPVCLEDLHTSITNLQILPCGHVTHMKCWEDMLKKGIYACPLCGQSSMDMKKYWRELDCKVAMMPMPDVYRNMKIYILCKDCHKTTEVLFHVVGLKCSACGSYNTCRSDPVRSNLPLLTNVSSNVEEVSSDEEFQTQF